MTDSTRLSFEDRKNMFEDLSRPLISADQRSPVESASDPRDGIASQNSMDESAILASESQDRISDLAPSSYPVEGDAVLKSGSQILSRFEVLKYGVIIGLVSAVFTSIYTAILEYLIVSMWTYLPDALHKWGWTQESQVPLQWYVPLACVVITLVTAVVAMNLKPHMSVNNFIDEIHKSGRASTDWVLPMIVVSLLSVSTGCSVGPEGAMIVVGGNMGGWWGARLGYPQDTVRWFSLVGSSACVSAFFGMPFAGSLFVITMLNQIGDVEFFEALKGSMISSIVCVAVSKWVTPALTLKPQPFWPGPDAAEESGDDSHWLWPTPTNEEVSLPVALIMGVLCGIVGTAVAWTFHIGDRGTFHVVQKLAWPRWATMLVGAVVFGIIGAMRPGTLFWSEHQIPYVLGSEKELDFLSPHLSENSIVGPLPLRGAMDGWEPFVHGVAKGFLAGFCKSLLFPGGIIYPMIYAGGGVGTAIRRWMTDASVHLAGVSSLAPAAVAAGAQGAVNKTPWATTLLVLGTHAGGAALTTFIAVVASVCVADFLTSGWLNSFYFQKPRENFVHPTEENTPQVKKPLRGILIRSSTQLLTRHNTM